MEEKREKKKTTSAKTLQTAREAGYFARKMLADTKAAVEEGRPVAWSMVDWWEGTIIAKAMGVELVFPENYGAFCAAVGAAEDNMEYAESDGFPATLCGYAKNCFGYARKLKENNFVVPADAPGGGMPRPTFLLGSGAACDARFKWFQALGRYMDVPVWVLEYPETCAQEYYYKDNKEVNIKFMVRELRDFVSFLEKILGKKMDWDILRQRLDIFFKTHQLAREVDFLRRAVPSPMQCTDFWSIMILHFYLADTPEALHFYQKVYEEVKYKTDNKIGAYPNEKYRMMFAELPPWHNLAFFDEIAKKHGIVFVIESWNYHAAPALPEEEIRRVTDPLEIIARYTFHKWHSGVSTAIKYNFEPPCYVAPFVEFAPDYRADGFMGHTLISCRSATYNLLHTRNVLLELLKIPSVIIEGDIIDKRVFNEEEALNKIAAFVETMDHYREVRKKEGFDW